MARPGLSSHRKFRRLARLLGSAILARGALELLWEPCYQTASDVLGTSDDIEHVVGWTGTPGALTHALLNAGLDDGGPGFIELVPGSPPDKAIFRVHDLFDHAPDYVRRRLVREQQRRGRSISELRAEAGKKGGTTKASKRLANVKQTASKRLANDSRLLQSGLIPKDQDLLDQDQKQDQDQNLQKDQEQDQEPVAQRPIALKNAWNAGIAGSGLPTCRGLSTSRAKKARARLQERPLEEWVAIIARIVASDFCRGANNRQWTANFDWLLQPDVALKVLEGQYDNRQTSAPVGDEDYMRQLRGKP